MSKAVKAAHTGKLDEWQREKQPNRVGLKPVAVQYFVV